MSRIQMVIGALNDLQIWMDLQAITNIMGTTIERPDLYNEDKDWEGLAGVQHTWQENYQISLHFIIYFPPKIISVNVTFHIPVESIPEYVNLISRLSVFFEVGKA